MKTLHQDPTTLSAQALSQAIHGGAVSCREVMQATLARVHRLNPGVNAIVALADDAALLAQADVRDAELAAGHSHGWMHGMPQAIKDIANATGFPTTMGCSLLKRNLPTQDSLIVERVKAAGALVIGKTNVPEFGLGSHSYNPVYGTTLNPWDTTRTAGGSSGGAAVALALNLLPVADGSDFMGSLRNPAGWNHVFGLRPSQGRVPMLPKPDAYVAQLGTEGPMARHVRDLAALLTTQAGFDPRVPLSLDTARETFVPTQRQAEGALRGLRIGWLGDLQGHLAMEPGVLACCEGALRSMEQGGAQVVPLAPTFEPEAVWRAWLVWRRALTSRNVGALMHLPGAREAIKPEAQWEYDQAQNLSFDEFMQASAARTRFTQHMVDMFEHVDVLALPSAQVWPFAVEQTWPRHIAGREMDTYHRWMEATLYATFAGLPAISMPAGFHENGRWPMGLQLIGRPRGDAALLQVAAGYERQNEAMLARRP
jgi:amidase